MKIDDFSLAFNCPGCPSWGTAIVNQDTLKVHLIKKDVASNIIIGMMHKCVSINTRDFSLPIGKGSRIYYGNTGFAGATSEPMLVSIFDKVFVNDIQVPAPFVMAIIKDRAEAHEGRLQLKYTPKMKYGEISNEVFFAEAEKVLSISDGTPWVIYDIDVVDQEELHFKAFISQDVATLQDMIRKLPKKEVTISVDEVESRRAAFKAYLFAPGTFKLASTARLYWNHVSVDKYKERVNFIWEALSTILGDPSDDIARIDNVEDAKKLRDIVLSDERNIAYNNMLGSAIVTKYVNFLSGSWLNDEKIGSDELSSSSIQPLSDTPDFKPQNIKYMAAVKTKPFMILGGFSGTGKSLLVKRLAFATCPCDGVLNTSETTPGNYLLVSVKPNWHDATDITGFRSSVNKNYYVTDFMRFLVKAKLYEDKNVPFFVCLDEMNLAPVEEYFADFLSVIESRKKRTDGKIVTDPIVPASVFNDSDYADDFNIFLKLGMVTTNPVNDVAEFSSEIRKHGSESDFFVNSWLVDELKRDGLTIPSNVIIIGTVNMDDTTNSFSRKVIDRAMTFETIVETFDTTYFDCDVALNYVKNPYKGELFISDEVRATQMLDEGTFGLTDEEKKSIIAFINGINGDLEGSPFKISYRILNETILLYRSMKEIEDVLATDDSVASGSIDTSLNTIFDDIVMQKILPRIEGDFEKCNKCLVALSQRAEKYDWPNSANKIEFMIERFGSDKSGFTSFWN